MIVYIKNTSYIAQICGYYLSCFLKKQCYFLIIILYCTLYSCISLKDNCSILKDNTIKIYPKTLLSNDSYHNCYIKAKYLLVPINTILVSKIKTHSAELREGPGIEFKIKDQLLEKESDIIIFDTLNTWIKVYSPQYDIIGWIHVQTIYKPELNLKEMKLNKQNIPKVFAIKNLKLAYDYISNKPITVNFKKGSFFYLLRINGKNKLVYIENTNSMIWFNNEEVQ